MKMLKQIAIVALVCYGASVIAMYEGQEFQEMTDEYIREYIRQAELASLRRSQKSPEAIALKLVQNPKIREADMPDIIMTRSRSFFAKDRERFLIAVQTALQNNNKVEVIEGIINKLSMQLSEVKTKLNNTIAEIAKMSKQDIPSIAYYQILEDLGYSLMDYTTEKERLEKTLSIFTDTAS